MHTSDPTLQHLLSIAPVPLKAIADHFGLPVYLSTLQPKISGLIEPFEQAPSKFRIRLNRHEPVERQRFTLAHEIAHFLLHRSLIGTGVVDDTMYRSGLSSRREVEANRLAAELCMPRSLVEHHRRLLSHLDRDQLISEMAKRFRVSKSAMQIRLGV